MRRSVCANCGSDRLEVFLDLGKTPLADRFPTSPDDPEDVYPLEVAVCRHCWLVQLLEVVPDDVLWSDYGFYSAASPSKRIEHVHLAAELLAAYPVQARRLTVEIGCNDGDLLHHFKAAGCEAVGVDPAEGPTEIAREAGLDVWTSPFGRVAAGVLLNDGPGPAGLIVARNVAAHVADPNDFFAGIAHLLAPDGVAVVEVQYVADLLAGNQFDHVYHEHRFYYSVGSLSKVANRAGLRIARLDWTRQQGGSLQATLVRGHDLNEHPSVNYERDRFGLQRMTAYAGFQGRVDYTVGRLVGLISDERKAGRRLAGYGATAKSTTLLNYSGIGARLLEYVEDLTPAKIGRYTPGTHIPVVGPPEDVTTTMVMLDGTQLDISAKDRGRPDVFLLLAWNYLGDVLRRERAFLDGGGRFLVPLPVPVLL